jgi:two-component system KDP operon response regulator KdpE
LKILIVDDEPDVRAMVRESLAYATVDLTPLEAADGEEALRLIDSERPDLVLLDLALPRRDGFSVLADLRRESDLPVIVLTARGLEDEKIRGLQLGADDYMTKPFSPRELVARIESVLRRSVPRAARGVIDRGPLQIDLAARQVRRSGAEVHFTPTEFNLLAELATHPGEALAHETLLMRVWGPEYRHETHYLKVYVGRLREKIESDPAEPRLIQTVRGVGYRFAGAEG